MSQRTLHLPPDPAGPPAPQERPTHLLLIAIDQYPRVGKLSNAVRDAEAFAEAFQAHYPLAGIERLTDAEASREKIIRKVLELGRSLPPGSNLILYYSGHGHFDPDMNMGYWVPVDGKYNDIASYLPYSDVLQWLKGPFKHLHHVLIIADSCHAGSLIESVRSGGGQEQYPSRWLLASGRNEVVPDGSAGGHSPFAQGLLSYLSAPPKPTFKLTELYNALSDTASEADGPTYLAAPLLVPGNQMGEFVFRKKRSEAADWADARARHSLLGYTEFLERYPQSAQREEARRHIRSLQEARDYQRLGSDPTLDELIGFLDKYPDDSELRRRALAQKAALVEELREEGPEAPPPAPTAPLPQRPANTLMARIGSVAAAALFLTYSLWRFWPESKPQEPATQQAGPMFIGYQGNPLLLPDSDFEVIEHEGKYGYRKAGQPAVLGGGGVLLIPVKYEAAQPFSEQLAAVKLGGKWGYINKGDSLVIPFQFLSAGNFSGGKAQVTSAEGKMGSINPQGQRALALQDLRVVQNQNLRVVYDYRSDKLASKRRLVRRDGLYGYLDENGKLAIALQYSQAEDFANGFAKVEKNGKRFMINPEGQCVLNCP